MTAKKLIKTLQEEGFDDQQILDGLEDGEALERLGITDIDVIEEAHDIVSKKKGD